MKIYSARESKFDADARIAELSPQKKDNSNEIKEACISIQDKLSKKFKEFDIKVSWSNKLDGYVIKIKDTKSSVSCVLEPLHPNSRGLTNLTTNIINNLNGIKIEALEFYIKRLSILDKICKTSIELVKNYTHTNVSHELEFLKSPNMRILMEHSSNPDIWVGNKDNSSYNTIYHHWDRYYRLDPDNHNYIQHVEFDANRMYLNTQRVDLKYIPYLNKADLITTDDLRNLISEIGINRVLDRKNLLGLGNLGGS